MKLYNTLSHQLEELKVKDYPTIKLYSCGPTVYDYVHIGNLRTFTFEDLLHRYLLYNGYEVKYIRNITDVDDKTIRKSNREHKPLKEVTESYAKAFFDDLEKLHILPADMYPRVTDNMDDIIKWINTLIEKDFAYKSDDGVYFRINKSKNYGQLVNLNTSTIQNDASQRTVNEEKAKEELSDFVLWKNYTPKDKDIFWDSPFGKGRPGWHTECAVLSTKYLGEPIDIHTGGIDLAFPHHTNEIAQVEALAKNKFCNYWVHVTHLLVDGTKMSKSKGNFFTLRDLEEKGYTARQVRYLLLSAHYKSPLNFTLDGLKACQVALDRLDDFIFFLHLVNNEKDNHCFKKDLDAAKKSFIHAIDEDFNTPEAFGAIFTLIKQVYEHQNNLSKKMALEILDWFKDIDHILGFLDVKQPLGLDEKDKKLLEERNLAKKEKNYQKADEIRDYFAKQNIILRDTPNGTIYYKK